MDLNQYFKSVIDQDHCQVVICDLDDTILYMNPAAIRQYAKRGGVDLVGRSLLACHNEHSCERIAQVKEWFAAAPDHNVVHTGWNAKKDKDIYMYALRDTAGVLIGYYERHEFRTQDPSPLYDLT